MDKYWWVWLIVAGVIMLCVIWVIATRNKFVKLHSNIEEAFSTMDVYLKKRYDLIPNLVETVKGYTKHESETLQKVIEARNLAMSMMSGSTADRLNAENSLTGTLKSLFSLTESYPDLKASSQFLDLQSQLKAIETEIAQSRKYYNAVVKAFNNAILVFPSNLVANVLKLEKADFFEIDEDIQRENIKVTF